MSALRPSQEPVIGDYGVIGNCHSAALVSREGFVDWLCLPSFSSPSCFAAVLDRDRGGHFALRARGAGEIVRRYRPGTNVLSTTYRSAAGTAVVDDCMPVSSEEQRRLRPDYELLRVATCTTGEVELELELRPRFDYGRTAASIRRRGGLGFFAEHRAGALVLHTDVDDRLSVEEGGEAVIGRVRLAAGERAAFSLAFADREPAIVPALGANALERVDRCAAWWRRWIARARYDGPYTDAVERSLLALRLLVYAPSGGMVAAATTSLPESIGGARNWDYRYCWLRDASMVVEVLFELGYEPEARAFTSWVLHTTRTTWPHLSPVYDVMGHSRLPERELDYLRGHRGSRPVRIGNAAARQKQLDSYGELIEATERLLSRSRLLDRATRRMLARLGRYVCAHWRDPDRGIWEVRGEERHHTHSKVMCWVALDRLIRLAERGEIDVDVHRMRNERDEIRALVERRGFDPAQGGYAATLGGSQADASLLLLSRYGFEDARSPRMRGTVELVRRELERNGVVARYPASVDDGVGGREHGFGVCCFWLVSALARQGDVDEASRLFESLLAKSNDLGLYAEEIDQDTGEAVGNLPQAFTHVGLVEAALSLERARGARTEAA